MKTQILLPCLIPPLPLKNASLNFLQKDSKEGIFRDSGGKEGGRRTIWVLIFQHLKLGPICAHMQKEF